MTLKRNKFFCAKIEKGFYKLRQGKFTEYLFIHPLSISILVLPPPTLI